MNEKLPNQRFLKIDEIYAFISHDDVGEGIMGFMARNGQWMPMIGSDLEAVNNLKTIANAIGAPYEIRYFKKV